VIVTVVDWVIVIVEGEGETVTVGVWIVVTLMDPVPLAELYVGELFESGV
jgi:hypothetical protein